MRTRNAHTSFDCVVAVFYLRTRLCVCLIFNRMRADAVCDSVCLLPHGGCVSLSPAIDLYFTLASERMHMV